jgi:hypothetical protein
MAGYLVYTSSNFKMNTAVAIYEREPELMKEFIMENYHSVFAGKDVKHIEHLSDMLDDLSATDSYSKWNQTNPAFEALCAYTVHVHRNRQITEKTFGSEPIKFPSSMMLQKERNQATKYLLSLHHKIAWSQPYEELQYYIDHVRNRIETYPNLPEYSTECGDSKANIIQYILSHNITDLNLKDLCERKKFTLNQMKLRDKTPQLNVGLGKDSLTHRVKEIYDPPISKPITKTKPIGRKRTLTKEVNVAQKKSKKS